MQQVLFNIPIFQGWWVFPPEGIPVYGFGAMLFVTFIATTWWATRRAKRVGLPAERMQDLAIVLFISGIIGARILYMIQYADQFPDRSIGSMIGAFFQIWKGGIIFYGSALGGAIGYGLFYWYVLRRLNVSGWQLADAAAPVICLGLALGRIGCYLNGCCWGQVACDETCPVPLGGEHLPLLSAHARDQLVSKSRDVPYGYLQTSTGFTIVPRDARANMPDPRTVVQAVEAGSAAEKAGLQPGDRVVGVNGRPNAIVVNLRGPTETGVREALELFKRHNAATDGPSHEAENRDYHARAMFDHVEDYQKGREAYDDARRAAIPVPGADAAPLRAVSLSVTDELDELARNWPRGRHELALDVERGTGSAKETVRLTFTPRSVSLYPTQLYETVSMVLLIFVLLAYYPFRRHDGQLMVLAMMGYSIHRFVNESIRIEPTVGLGLTLSQWGSVVIFLAAAGVEAYLWWVMPPRWAKAPE